MADKKWLNRYENIKEKLYSKIDFESYFSEKQIGGVNIDTLEIGTVHFPTGTVFACDPLVELEDGEFFGFGVDAGMGCIADIQTQEEYKKYWKKRCEEDGSIDPYNDLFCDILEESYQENPKYQREGGDWANWHIPETDYNIPVFASGWGDGCYPCYFGYDENNAVCGVYIRFIDIAEEYSE